MRLAFLGAAAAALLSATAQAQILEDFEGNLNSYTVVSGGANIIQAASSAHDGALGASFPSGSSGFYYDTAKTVNPGDTMRSYVRTDGSGRIYMGFAADQFGCFSAVMAPNTGELLLQDNAGYSFSNVSTAPFTWTAGIWYLLEVDWAVNGDVIVNLYDDPGTTLLASTPSFNIGSPVANGVAMRGFSSGSNDYDTVSNGPGLPGFSSYCTAKINSLGCTPAVSSTGSNSVTATSGFTVDCAMVRNNKSGLLFYKVGGAQASVTFQCGTLCVGPSGIKRTPAQSAGGNAPPANDCSGMYSLDMNAFAAGMAGGNPDPALLIAGPLVHCQWWGRDQGFASPCNTTLSDGGEYTLNP